MGSRYFFISFLPTLTFDTSPELSLHEIEFFLRLNLSSRELSIVNALYQLYDLENIKLFLMGFPMSKEGNISHDEIREKIENDECPLPVLRSFFSLYPTLDERKKHIHELTLTFFKAASSLPHFVRQYFWIEHISRYLFASLRATARGKTFDVPEEEIGFDIHDTKSWPEIFSPLLSIWQTRQHSPSDLEEAVSKWKFDILSSLCADSPPFSLDYVLAYLLQLRLVESRRELKNPNLNTIERIAKAVQ